MRVRLFYKKEPFASQAQKLQIISNMEFKLLPGHKLLFIWW